MASAGEIQIFKRERIMRVNLARSSRVSPRNAMAGTAQTTLAVPTMKNCVHDATGTTENASHAGTTTAALAATHAGTIAFLTKERMESLEQRRTKIRRKPRQAHEIVIAAHATDSGGADFYIKYIYPY